MNKFPGHISAIEKKSDDSNQDEDVLIEVTDTGADGMVEIALDDRNERFYARFKLQDLVQAAMKHLGGETS
jgi:hypothetical protein